MLISMCFLPYTPLSLQLAILPTLSAPSQPLEQNRVQQSLLSRLLALRGEGVLGVSSSYNSISTIDKHISAR